MMEKICCPVCGQNNQINKETAKATVTIKGVDIEYDETYFTCSHCESEGYTFTTGEIEDQNLLNARNAYRRTAGLLTSEEIISIRKKYNLSQSDFALLLGWGEVTISRYETKAIQDQAHDNLLRIVNDDPQIAYNLLRRNRDKFEENRYRVVKEKILKALDDFGEDFMMRKSLCLDYIRYDEGSVCNGFEVLNVDKLEEIIAYYVKRIQNLSKPKAVHLLWLADALKYKENGKAMSGLVYIRNKEHVSPVGEQKIFQLQNLDANVLTDCDEVKYNARSSTDDNWEFLNRIDIQILDTVIECFGNLSLSQMKKSVCQEKTFQCIPVGNVIDFESIKTLKILEKPKKVSAQSVDTANLI